jgi:hypothetical protein
MICRPPASRHGPWRPESDLTKAGADWQVYLSGRAIRCATIRLRDWSELPERGEDIGKPHIAEDLVPDPNVIEPDRNESCQIKLR